MTATVNNSWRGPTAELDRLLRSWQPVKAIRRVREILGDSKDRRLRAQSRLYGLAALVNVGRIRSPEYERAVEHARDELEAVPEPALLAELDVLRGARAAAFDDVAGAVILAARARHLLEADPDRGMPSCLAWRDLANLENSLRMSDRALDSNTRADELDCQPRQWQTAGLMLETALIKDQHGDTEGAIPLLEQTAALRHPGSGQEMADTYSGYALARLAALGVDVDLSAGLPFPDRRGDPFTNGFRDLARACLRIHEGDPHRALWILDTVSPMDWITGVEVFRLRSLAYAIAGEATAARAAERDMFRAATGDVRRLRELAVTGARAAQERDALVGLLRERADNAFTDTLTGLSNRRHFDLMWPELAAHDGVIVGMLDLDDFKHVNTVHGHRVGDRVLRRAARLLWETLEPDAYFARFGGDEFVV
ncbi:MAG: GGDEF domain-containing protein, partial [Actinomycetales bacterium]|nr:GGDEF domain-containing protein [Actinomycetales bacterium]